MPHAKNFSEHFITALAALASLVTCIALLYQESIQEMHLSPVDNAVILTAIVLGCAIYSCFMIQRKTKVSFLFNPQFILTVEQGDLFEKKGVIVIPVNEYFDTHVGDGIISPRTIHGKWIHKYFSGKINELNDLISSGLAGRPFIQRPARQNGKARQYELGTCINIPIGESVYVLVALTHFDNDNHAFLDRKDYPIVFDRLISHLKHMRTEKPVFMPLMGTGLSRLRRTPQRILNFLVDAIDFKYSDLAFPQGMNIEIFDIDTVNLNDLESYVENGLTL